jgi:hypothetical protein
MSGARLSSQSSEFFGGSLLAEVTSRAMLMIILRRNGLSIRVGGKADAMLISL